MSYIVSVVVLEPSSSLGARLSDMPTGEIVLQVVSQGPEARWRACYVTALRRRLGMSPSEFAIYVLKDTGGGYLTSSPFVMVPNNDKDLIKLQFPDEFRQSVAYILQALLKESTIGQLLVVCEPTFGLLRSVPDERYDGYEILGPMSLGEFWTCHDQGAFSEETICKVSATARD